MNSIGDQLPLGLRVIDVSYPMLWQAGHISLGVKILCLDLTCVTFMKYTDGFTTSERCKKKKVKTTLRSKGVYECGSCHMIFSKKALKKVDVKLGIWLCAREDYHWRKWHILAPVPPPVDHICQNCGKKRGLGILQWSTQLQIWALLVHERQAGAIRLHRSQVCVSIPSARAWWRGRKSRRRIVLLESLDVWGSDKQLLTSYGNNFANITLDML